MNTTLSHSSVGLLAGAGYGLLRALSTGRPFESIASGLMLAVFVFVILHRKQVLNLRQVGKVFSPARTAWVSAVVALGVAGMGVVRHSVVLHTAVLDSVFAFLFFLALGSLFGHKRHAESNDRAA